MSLVNVTWSWPTSNTDLSNNVATLVTSSGYKSDSVLGVVSSEYTSGIASTAAPLTKYTLPIIYISTQVVYGDWIQIQLSTATPISFVQLFFRPQYESSMAQSFMVLASTDGSNWNYIGGTTQSYYIQTAYDNTLFMINATSILYSYFRIVITQANPTVMIGGVVLYSKNFVPLFTSGTNSVSGNTILYGASTVATLTWSWSTLSWRSENYITNATNIASMLLNNTTTYLGLLASDEYPPTNQGNATLLSPYTVYSYAPNSISLTLPTNTWTIPSSAWTVSLQTYPTLYFPPTASSLLSGTFGVSSLSKDGAYQLIPSSSGTYYICNNGVWTQTITPFTSFTASAVSSSGQYQWMISSTGLFFSNTYGASFSLIQPGIFSWVSISPSGTYVLAGNVPTTDPSISSGIVYVSVNGTSSLPIFNQTTISGIMTQCLVSDTGFTSSVIITQNVTYTSKVYVSQYLVSNMSMLVNTAGLSWTNAIYYYKMDMSYTGKYILLISNGIVLLSTYGSSTTTTPSFSTITTSISSPTFVYVSELGQCMVVANSSSMSYSTTYGSTWNTYSSVNSIAYISISKNSKHWLIGQSNSILSSTPLGTLKYVSLIQPTPTPTPIPIVTPTPMPTPTPTPTPLIPYKLPAYMIYGQWIQVKYYTPVTLSGFRLYPRSNTTTLPTGMILIASKDGLEWDFMKQVINQSLSSVIPVSTKVEYSYFRLVIIQANTSTVEFGAFMLYSNGIPLVLSSDNYKTTDIISSSQSLVGTLNINSIRTVYGHWFQITFPSSTEIASFQFVPRLGSTTTVPKTMYILGSLDGNDWTFIGKMTNVAIWINGEPVSLLFNPFVSYTYYRFVVSQSSPITEFGGVICIGDDGNPLFGTSNGYTKTSTKLIQQNVVVATLSWSWSNYDGLFLNTPFVLTSDGYKNSYLGFYFPSDYLPMNGGIATSVSPDTVYTNSTAVTTNTTSSTYGEWIQIYLVAPIVLTGFDLAPQTNYTENMFTSFVCLGSNDSINWTFLTHAENIMWYVNTASYFPVVTTNAYSYYRLIITQVGSDTTNIGKWNLYTDAGLVFPSSYGYTTSGINNQTLTGYSTPLTLSSGEWIQLKLSTTVTISGIKLVPSSLSTLNSFVLLGSNDGNVWNLLVSKTCIHWNANVPTFFKCSATYSYFRLVATNSNEITTLSGLILVGSNGVSVFGPANTYIVNTTSTSSSLRPNLSTPAPTPTPTPNSTPAPNASVVLTWSSTPSNVLIVCSDGYTQGAMSTITTKKSMDALLFPVNPLASSSYYNSWTIPITNNENVYGEWIQIQYASSYTITSFKLCPRTSVSQTFINSFYVLGSSDGTNWNLMYVSDSKYINTNPLYNIVPSTVKYVRVVITQSPSSFEIGQLIFYTSEGPILGNQNMYTASDTILKLNGVTVATVTWSWSLPNSTPSATPQPNVAAYVMTLDNTSGSYLGTILPNEYSVLNGGWASDTSPLNVYNTTDLVSNVNSTVKGHWFQVKLDSPVWVSCFKLIPTASTLFNKKNTTFMVVASNDGVSWTYLMDNTDPYLVSESTFFYVTPLHPYSYYRLILKNTEIEEFEGWVWFTSNGLPLLQGMEGYTSTNTTLSLANQTKATLSWSWYSSIMNQSTSKAPAILTFNGSKYGAYITMNTTTPAPTPSTIPTTIVTYNPFTTPSRMDLATFSYSFTSSNIPSSTPVPVISNYVYGNYFQVQFPFSVVATAFQMGGSYGFQTNSSQNRTASNLAFLGSNDGQSWYPIGTNTNTKYYNGTYTTINVSNTISYSYYRVVAKQMNTGNNGYWDTTSFTVLNGTTRYPPIPLTSSVLSGQLYGNGTYVLSTNPVATVTNAMYGVLGNTVPDDGSSPCVSIGIQNYETNGTYSGSIQTLLKPVPTPTPIPVIPSVYNNSQNLAYIMTPGQDWISFSSVDEYPLSNNGLVITGPNIQYSLGTIGTVLGHCIGEWVQLSLPKPIVVTGFNLVPTSSPSMPLSYIFLGSNDNISWIFLNRVEFSEWSVPEPVPVMNSVEYSYYRIIFTRSPSTMAIRGIIPYKFSNPLFANIASYTVSQYTLTQSGKNVATLSTSWKITDQNAVGIFIEDNTTSSITYSSTLDYSPNKNNQSFLGEYNTFLYPSSTVIPEFTIATLNWSWTTGTSNNPVYIIANDAYNKQYYLSTTLGSDYATNVVKMSTSNSLKTDINTKYPLLSNLNVFGSFLGASMSYDGKKQIIPVIGTSSYYLFTKYPAPAWLLRDLNFFPVDSVLYGEWVRVQLTTPSTVVKYQIVPQTMTTVPTSWTLLASNDGALWTILDVQKNQSITSISTYTLVSASAVYSYYQLVITSTNTSNFCELGGWYLWNSNGPLFPFSYTTSGTNGTNLVYNSNTVATLSYSWSSSNVVPELTQNSSLILSNTNTNSFVGFSVPVIIQGEWIQIEIATSTYQVTQYQILPRAGLVYRLPQSWMLYGSIDGTTWVIVDIQILSTSTTFTIKNPDNYKYYRFVITSVASSTTNDTYYCTNIGGIYLMTSPSTYLFNLPLTQNQNSYSGGSTTVLTSSSLFSYNVGGTYSNLLQLNGKTLATITTSWNFTNTSSTIKNDSGFLALALVYSKSPNTNFYMGMTQVGASTPSYSLSTGTITTYAPVTSVSYTKNSSMYTKTYTSMNTLTGYTCMSDDASSIIMGSTYGYYLSTNGGITFKPYASPSASQQPIACSSLFKYTAYGVYQSTYLPAFSKKIIAVSSLSRVDVTDTGFMVGLTPTNVYLVNEQGGNMVFTITNGVDVAITKQGKTVYVATSTSLYVFPLTATSLPSPQSIPGISGGIVGISIDHKGLSVYVATSTSVSCSFDSGNTWSVVYTGIGITGLRVSGDGSNLSVLTRTGILSSSLAGLVPTNSSYVGGSWAPSSICYLNGMQQQTQSLVRPAMNGGIQQDAPTRWVSCKNTYPAPGTMLYISTLFFDGPYTGTPTSSIIQVTVNGSPAVCNEASFLSSQCTFVYIVLPTDTTTINIVATDGMSTNTLVLLNNNGVCTQSSTGPNIISILPEFYPTVVITITPNLVSTITPNSVNTELSPLFYVNPKGGSGVFSYEWSITGVPSATPTTTSASSCAFNAILPVGTYTSLIKCKIIDLNAYYQTTVTTQYTWHSYYTPFTVASITPPPTPTPTILGSYTQTSDTFVATTTGGSGTYSYDWSLEGGNISSYIVNSNSSSSSTTFTATLLAGPSSISTVKCSITDTMLGTVNSAISYVVWQPYYFPLVINIKPVPTPTPTLLSTITQTSSNYTCTVTGGTGSYNFVWSTSGGNVSGITVHNISSTNSSISIANFTATMLSGPSSSSSIRCTVTDTIDGETNYGTSTAVWQPYYEKLKTTITPLSTPTPTLLSTSSQTSSTYTCVPSGGSGTFTYAWSISGGNVNSIVINSSTSASTTFTASMKTGVSSTSTVTCVVMDTIDGDTSTSTSTVIWQPYYLPLLVTINPVPTPTPTLLSTSSQTSSNYTCTVSGGTGSYTFSWSTTGGNVSAITVNTVDSTNSSISLANFTAAMLSGPSSYSTVKCIVTDTIDGESTYATSTVTWQPYYTRISATIDTVQTPTNSNVVMSGNTTLATLTWSWSAMENPTLLGEVLVSPLTSWIGLSAPLEYTVNNNGIANSLAPLTTYNTRPVASITQTMYGEWIQIQLTDPVILTSFQLVPYNPNSMIQSFALLGSNDGTMWTYLMSNTNTILWSNNAPLSFTTTTTTSFTYYRLIVTQGPVPFNLSGFILYGSNGPVLSTSSSYTISNNTSLQVSGVTKATLTWSWTNTYNQSSAQNVAKLMTSDGYVSNPVYVGCTNLSEYPSSNNGFVTTSAPSTTYTYIVPS